MEMLRFLFAAAMTLQPSPSDDGAAARRDLCTPATYEAWSTSFAAEGAPKSEHDRANRRCFYGGRGEIAEYWGLDGSNQPYFRGVSITIWNADRSLGRTLWAMVGVDGFTDIRQKWEGDRLVTEGAGEDPGGVFKERSTTTFKPGGDFHFSMDRSFDGGETWIAPFNVIEYLKTPAPPPPSPSEWADQFAGFAPQRVEDGGRIILDGRAWGAFIEDKEGRPAGYKFASVAPKDGGWVWRTIVWTFKDGVADTTDIPLQ